jgi:hypothetical protein
MPPPVGGAGAGMGGGAADSVRGGNPYLNMTPNAGGVVGDSGPRRPVDGANTGAVGFGGGQDFGPAGGAGAHGAAVAPGGNFGNSAPPPMAPNSGAAGGHAQDDSYEGSSYLVEADGVFDDGRMVAPPVLGGDGEQ